MFHQIRYQARRKPPLLLLLCLWQSCCWNEEKWQKTKKITNAGLKSFKLAFKKKIKNLAAFEVPTIKKKNHFKPQRESRVLNQTISV